VLREFRARVSPGDASERFLETLLTHGQAQGLLRAGGRPRTDATHVLAAVRVLNRLELGAETRRTAFNAVAVAEPAWLTRHVPQHWSQRYSRRIA
jgi:transposase